MSTRGIICIKLREEDLNQDLHMKNSLGQDLLVRVHTASGFPYMYVYCHHDSYIENPGLGYFLPRKLQTYEEVRDFILQGDRTSLETPYTDCGENAEDLKPNFAMSVDGEIPEQYFYLFEDGKWFVKNDAPNAKFKELEYKPVTIELNSREIEAVKYVFEKYLSMRDLFKETFTNEGTDIVLIKRINDIKKKIKEVDK